MSSSAIRRKVDRRLLQVKGRGGACLTRLGRRRSRESSRMSRRRVQGMTKREDFGHDQRRFE